MGVKAKPRNKVGGAAAVAEIPPPVPESDPDGGLRLVITIDTRKKQRFLVTSEVAALRTWEATEAELFAEVLKYYPKYTLASLFRDGAISFAKRKLAEARSVKMRGQTTRLGSADKRLERAKARLIADNAKAKREGRTVRKITPWTLSATANTSWRTAARWLSEQQESQDRSN